MTGAGEMQLSRKGKPRAPTVPVQNLLVCLLEEAVSRHHWPPHLHQFAIERTWAFPPSSGQLECEYGIHGAAAATEEAAAASAETSSNNKASGSPRLRTSMFHAQPVRHNSG
jgi:hypothetical protein